jgi:hypothetical protein
VRATLSRAFVQSCLAGELKYRSVHNSRVSPSLVQRMRPAPVTEGGVKFTLSSQQTLSIRNGSVELIQVWLNLGVELSSSPVSYVIRPHIGSDGFAGLHSILHSTSCQSAIMATASELDKIRSNPIKERLGAFRRLFESTRSGLGVALSSGAVQIVFAAAATPGMAQLLLASFLVNVHSCQKPVTRPHPSSADRTSCSYPPFPNS